MEKKSQENLHPTPPSKNIHQRSLADLNCPVGHQRPRVPNALLQALQRGDEAMALRLLNSNLSIMNLWLVNQLVSLNKAL